MKKFAIQLKRRFAFSIAVSLGCVALASVAFAADADLQLVRRTLNVGLIRSISVPINWTAGAVENSNSREFMKDGKDLWDCTQHFEVSAPLHLDAELLWRLNELTKLSKLSASDLDSIKILPYFDESLNIRAVHVTGTVYSANGRGIVVVEHCGKRIGACQPISGGGTRRPLISFVSGVAYIPAGKETIQTIRFVSEVMGDTKPCHEVIRSMLKSIEWQDQ
ncbi:hypothetical protein BH10CYA1_BH10CYA1_15660 [soil metagenome]